MTLPIGERTIALEAAVRAGEGRLPIHLLDEARAVIGRVRERGGLSAEHTVIALAGATGSGKSSVFNALAGADLAPVGVQRPTTSHAMAAVWEPDRGAGGDEAARRPGRRPRFAGFGPGGHRAERSARWPAAPTGAEPLLDWLEVRRRHEIAAPVPAAGAMVLLDLPDHDSIVAEHRVRAERLVERTDLLAWVVDPQKYADAALHERFLRPLAEHSDIVIVVLNQIDRLAPADAEACLADLRRLVHQDGLVRARVLGVSARTGEGMDELRSLLMGAAARREAAGLRLAADVRGVARQLSAACAAETDAGGGAVRSAKGALVDTLATAAGVPVVVAAVRGAALRDARAATGWPVTRWLARLRPDPLRRIGLRPAAPRPDLLRSSLPAASTAARAAAQAAVRDYARQVTADLPDGWALAARSVVLDAGRGLPDALDQAVLGTDLGLGRRPVWWRVVGGLQWAALAVLIVGLGWLAGLAALGWLQLAAPDPPTWRGLPMPTGLLVVGLIAGLGLAAVARGCAIVGARRRAAAVGRRLRAAVGAVVEREVRVPMLGELDALRTCRMAAAVAGG